jgi:hypothetical protein
VLNHGLYIGLLGNIGNLSLDLFGLRDYLFQLGRSLLQSWAGDIGEKDIGAFPGKEDGCLKTDATKCR